MYCPIDKAKTIWLCLTLLVVFILVLCIVLPITLTHPRTDTCAVEGCLFDNECLDRCTSENNQLTTDQSTIVPPPVSTTDSSTYPIDPPVSTTDSSTYPTDPPVTDPPVTCSPTACNKACTLGC